MKKFLKILAGIAIVLLLIWVGGRYGWKLMGFRACGGSGIESVVVEENRVEIVGFYPGSFPEGCVGYTWSQEGDVLYFGVRYDPIFGVFETGSFRAEIPVEGEVHTVYLKTGTDVYPIWSSESMEGKK